MSKPAPTSLGVHDGHNAAAAILRNGRIIAAVQEERLTRRKNQGGIPRLAMEEVTRAAGLSAGGLERVALAGSYMTYDHWDPPALLASFDRSSRWIEKIKTPVKHTFVDRLYRGYKARDRTRQFEGLGYAPLAPVDHHTAHASAAYYGSGMDGTVLVLTCDGTGDRLAATVSIGRGGRLERLAAVPEDDSIGYLYSLVTYLLGMMPLEHEYKVMGLAPYVDDKAKMRHYASLFEGLFEFDPKSPMTWRRRRGVPPLPRAKDFLARRLRRQRFDLVASGLQAFTEQILRQWVRNCVRETGIRRVACSGGVFMNVKANKDLLALPEVDELFVFPSCGDETNSIGALYWLEAQAALTRGAAVDIEPVEHMSWGREFDDAEAEEAIAAASRGRTFRARHVDDIECLSARHIAQGDVVARAKGRMEFGARALGNRSILARADSPHVVRIINDIIKCRDFWMPFAPAVLAERADEYYVKPKPMPAPFMIVAFDSRPETRARCHAAQHPYDYTMRPQEVTERANSGFYRLLKYYEGITGDGILLNTSFNLHGFPIVYGPKDAIDVFVNSGLGYLALGNWWLSKP